MPVFSFASHRNHHIYAFLSVLFVFFLKFPKNAKKQLTGRDINAKMQSKLNRLIEARYPSVPPAKPVQLRNGKGATAEVPGNACCPVAGSAEKICRTVTSFFVKRYHWLFGKARWGRFSVYSMNRLAKRFIFFIIPSRRGKRYAGQEGDNHEKKMDERNSGPDHGSDPHRLRRQQQQFFQQ